jgi:L-fucose isomerase-like protein
MTLAQRPITLGLVVGNRGFFPAHVVLEGRNQVIQALEGVGVRVIALEGSDTKGGGVENLAEAEKCARLLRAHREEIDGLLVTLPNFGDERAVSHAIRASDLGVPVLIHAFPDEVDRLGVKDRRDSFCGKMSVCNNLRQYGIKFSLTTRHTMAPSDPDLKSDLERFVSLCRVVRGMRGARLGMMGARPAAFKTVRFSEKLLERSGISVDTIDLSEVLGQIEKLDENAPRVQAKAEAMARYVNTRNVPGTALSRMARFGVVLDNWTEENALDATAIQCWTALQDYFGIMPCTLMSMASNGLNPSACETDIVGALAMLALQHASGKPSALVDWNNNYGDDPDMGVIFHCSNLPKDVFMDLEPEMNYNQILGESMDHEQIYGTIKGRVSAKPLTYLRISTDDLEGRMRAYVGEGESTDDALETFGGVGVVRIPRFQELLAYICEQGFEHHVTINQARVAGVVHEALGKYLGWDVYHHRA